LTAASQNLFDLVMGRNIALYPDAGLRLAASRAIAVESARGWRLDKVKVSHKIDSIVVLSMAALAAVRSEGDSNYDSGHRGWQDVDVTRLNDQLTTARRLFWNVKRRRGDEDTTPQQRHCRRCSQFTLGDGEAVVPQPVHERRWRRRLGRGCWWWLAA
jgi:hypothetical protein